MNKISIKKMILTAVLAALCCVATMVITIPVPATSGYIHPGDSIILLSGILFGAGCGFFTGGIGSMFADIFLGYGHWAPFTFVIKGLMGLLAGMTADYNKGNKKIFSLRNLIAVLVCEAVMVIGYFIAEIFLYGGVSPALASTPANLLQAAGGAVIYFILVPVISKVARDMLN